MKDHVNIGIAEAGPAGIATALRLMDRRRYPARQRP